MLTKVLRKNCAKYQLCRETHICNFVFISRPETHSYNFAMEAVSKTEQLKRIRSELIHGSYLARQLQTNIKNDDSSSQESIRIFIEGLLNSCSVSISMLTSLKLPKHTRMTSGSRRAKSFGDKENPVPEDADCTANAQNCNTKSRKRKCVKRVTQVTLTEGAGLETALEDGYSWRKYGQKDILGSRYPRGYYRCTHKITECCSARKQIQRIDDEQGPPVFTITLFGDHSCSHHQQLQRTSQLSSSPPNNDIPFPDQNAPPRVNYALGYHNTSVVASASTLFGDYLDVGFYKRGGVECSLPSAVMSPPDFQTEMNHQQTEFHPFFDILNWDFSG